MELVFTVAIPFLIVVACLWVRIRPQFNLRPIPMIALSVVLTGSVLGSEFFNLPAGPIPITLDRVLVGVLVGAFAVLFLLGKEDLRKLNRVDFSILALMGTLFFSTVTHDWKFLNNMPASRLLFFNLIPLVIYWVVRSCNLGTAELKFIAAVMGLFGVYLALTAIAEVKGISAIVFPRYIMTSETKEFLGRGRGPFLNPVSNGIFMTTCFCCVLAWWPRAKTNGKLVIMTVALVFAAGIYCTLTRSVWLGFIVACGVFIWLPAPRRLQGSMIVLATLVTIVAFPVLSEKIFSFKRDKEVTQSEMEQSAQMRPLFADRPLAGCGFGQYARAKYPYLQDPHSGKPLSITKSLMQHNVFLAYLTETGLIGFSLLVIMLIQMARVCWKVWSDQSLDLWARQFALISLVILSCYVINGMFHDTSIIPIQHVLMFFMFGLVNNVYSNAAAFSIVAQPVKREAQRHETDGCVPSGVPAGSV